MQILKNEEGKVIAYLAGSIIMLLDPETPTPPVRYNPTNLLKLKEMSDIFDTSVLDPETEVMAIFVHPYLGIPRKFILCSSRPLIDGVKLEDVSTAT